MGTESVELKIETFPHPTCRNEALDALKGLAIVGVVVAHMNFVGRFSEQTLFWIGMLQQSFGWCVIAFFFCAGMLTQYEELNQVNGWFRFFLKRTRRLIVPCLAFSLTYKICLIALKHVANLGQSISLPTGNFVNWINFLFTPVGPQFYFLPYLFMVSISSVFMIFLAKGATKLSWIVLIGSATFYFMQPIPLLTYGPSKELIPGYCFSFWLGLMARQNWRKNRGWWIAVFFTILFGSIYRETVNYAQFILPVILYLALSKVGLNKGLTLLGRESGSIYVWHDPLLLPACSILAAKFLPSEAMQVTVILGLGIGISIIAGNLVERFRYLGWYRF